MYTALQQVGNANFRANSYSGFDEPVGDPAADVDNDPEFKDSTLRFYDALADLRRFVEAREAEGAVAQLSK